MNLDDVHRGIQANRRKRRVGRGPGSGRGKTASRGHKGQGSRAGYSKHPMFEGGRMPLFRRIPKRGFNNQWAHAVAAVNVSQLDKLFDNGEEVSPESLKAKGLLKSRYDLLKVLGNGALEKKLKVSAHRFSKSAQKKIQAAGGEVITLAVPERGPKEASE